MGNLADHDTRDGKKPAGQKAGGDFTAARLRYGAMRFEMESLWVVGTPLLAVNP